jgi:hypothetical protein
VPTLTGVAAGAGAAVAGPPAAGPLQCILKSMIRHLVIFITSDCASSTVIADPDPNIIAASDSDLNTFCGQKITVNNSAIRIRIWHCFRFAFNWWLDPDPESQKRLETKGKNEG